MREREAVDTQMIISLNNNDDEIRRECHPKGEETDHHWTDGEGRKKGRCRGGGVILIVWPTARSRVGG